MKLGVTLFVVTLLVSSLYFGYQPNRAGVETNQEVETITIIFRATVTVSTDHLQIQEIRFVDGYSVNIFEMEEVSPSVYEYSFNLIPGTVFKYRYALGWPEWETSDVKNDPTNAYYRVLLVPGQDKIIEEDVVGFTVGQPAPGTTFVNVTGQIIDASTGQGLEEGNLWIGGMRAEIGRNGSFYIRSVVGGNQRMTILPYTYSYRVVELNLVVPVNSFNNEIVLDPIEVQPADPITVSFAVKVPNFPNTNQLRLVGDRPDIGHTYATGQNLRSPVMQHLIDNWYIATLDLHAGNAITYLYTFGSTSINNELDETYTPRYRKAVFHEDTIVKDEIFAWKDEANYEEIEVNVEVPETTPKHETVYFWHGNTLVPMKQISEFFWRTHVVLPSWQSELHYSYQLGTFTAVFNELGYDNQNRRVVDTSVGVIQDEVTAWRWINNATDTVGDMVNITLGVNVPFYTPSSDTLYLVGGYLGWSDPQAQQLTRRENHYFETNLVVQRDEEYEFTVTRGNWADVATRNFTISGRFGGQLVHDYIDGWIDMNHPWNRSSMLGGVMIMDWWDPSMKSMVAPAFERFSRKGGMWVQYAPQWSVDHLNPTPYIGSKGGTPDKDLTYLVEQAHQFGLKFYLHVGINNEVASDFTEVALPDYNSEQWGVYRKAFLEVVDHHSSLAQSLGIEMLALPNYVGNNITAYDALMNESIDLVRSQYSGMLSSSIGWTNTEYTFPGKLDHVGMYLWDDYLVGNDDPSVEELVVAIGDNLDTRYKPFAQRFDKSILFAQFAHASVVGSNYQRDLELGFNTVQDEEYSQVTQGRVYEAFMQAIANRTWIEGAFSFGYFYFPLDYPDYSITHKQAEAVLLKWTQMFGDDNYVGIESKFLLQDNFKIDIGTNFPEVRFATGENSMWSEWSTTSSPLDVEQFVSKSYLGGGKSVIWLQGKNANNFSKPVTVSVLTDTSPPVGETTVTEGGVWFSFDDDTSVNLKVQFAFSYSDELQVELHGKTVFLPNEILGEVKEVRVMAKDELSNQETLIMVLDLDATTPEQSSTSSEMIFPPTSEISDSGFLDSWSLFTMLVPMILICFSKYQLFGRDEDNS